MSSPNSRLLGILTRLQKYIYIFLEKRDHFVITTKEVYHHLKQFILLRIMYFASEFFFLKKKTKINHFILLFGCINLNILLFSKRFLGKLGQLSPDSLSSSIGSVKTKLFMFRLKNLNS